MSGELPDLGDDDLLILSIIITNGTIFNKRVERIIEQIPTVISISLDGATRKTVELIRKMCLGN